MRRIILVLLLTAICALLPAASAHAQTRSPDFDDDGKVDFEDFFLFVGAFGGSDTQFDLDRDGRVDLDDLFLFVADFGRTVGPSEGISPSPPSPGALPYVKLYSSDSPINQKIPANPEIDPQSDTMIQGFQDLPFLIQLKQYSTPVYFASDTTPRVDVILTCGPTWELGVTKLTNVPIPERAEPSNDYSGGSPPQGCGEDSYMDNQMVILDLANGCEYDFWQARKEEGRWYASWGNSIKINSSGIYPKGLSTRGSGFAFLAGVIWPQELEAGSIEHALVFSYPYAKAGGPVDPATDSDGTITELFALPEGARLQLDPTINLDSLNLTPYEKTIAKALQEYGMFLVDSGESAVGLYAIDPRSTDQNPYGSLLPDEDYPSLEHIPLDEFRVLKLPPQNPDLNPQWVSSGCGVFE